MIFSDFGMDTASLAGSLESKLAAIRHAGFSQVMISASDVVGHPAGVASGARVVRDSGLKVTGLEALRDFEGLSGRLHEYKVDVAKSMLEVCAALGGRLLLVEASTSTHADASADAIDPRPADAGDAGDPDGHPHRVQGRVVEPYCDRFRRRGRPRVSRQLPESRARRRRLRRPGRAHPAGRARGDRSAADLLVQLSDYMWQQIRSVEEEAATATHFRVFPGEGAHSDDLAGFVSTLDGIGYCGDYSFDVYNDDYQQMPAETVVRRAHRAAEWLAETVLRRALPVPNTERLARTARR